MKWSELADLIGRVEKLERIVHHALAQETEITTKEEPKVNETETTRDTGEFSLDSLAKDVADVRALVQDIHGAFGELLALHKQYGFTSAFLREVGDLHDNWLAKGQDSEVQPATLTEPQEAATVESQPPQGS